MATHYPASQRTPLRRFVDSLFGGPLLRLPKARSREGRRLRWAIGLSIIFHGALFAGGAMLSAAGLLRGGGTVTGIEVTFETRGLDTGPLTDQDYAPRPDHAEPMPDPDAAEALPEDETPSPMPEAPRLLADASAPESLPASPDRPEAPPAELPPEPSPRLDGPGRATMPDQLETPRGIEPVPAVDDAEPAQPPQRDQPARTELPEQLETSRGIEPPPVASDASEPPPDLGPAPTAPRPPPQPAPDSQTAEAPEPPVRAAPDHPGSPAPALQAAPPVPDVSGPAPTDRADTEQAPPPAIVEPPSPTPQPLEPLRTPSQLAALDSPLDRPQPPVVRRFQVPDPATPAPDPEEQLPAPAPDTTAEPPPSEPTSTLAAPAPDSTAEPPPSETPPALAAPVGAPSTSPETAPIQSPSPPSPLNSDVAYAPPPLDPRIDSRNRAVQTGRADGLDAEINAILSDISCGSLQAVVGDSGRVAVRGFLTSSTEHNGVRNRLLGLGGVTGVEDEMVEVVGEGLCKGLGVYAGGTTAVAPDAEVNEDLPPVLRGRPLFGTVQGARETFAGTDYLEAYLESPGYPAHVYIDFFRPDGVVVHLQPSELHPETYVPEPGTTIVISSMESDGISVPAGPPYGLGMVVTLSANAPVFQRGDIRPREEPAEAYLRDLEVAVRERELNPEFEAQYGYVFVEAVRESADNRSTRLVNQ